MVTCDKCMWCEQCGSDEVCEHYDPINEDEYIEVIIKTGRLEFSNEWFAYAGRDE